MKVLVTGGSGFLGAWVVRLLLQAGVDVRIFDRITDRRILHEIVGPEAGGLEWRSGDVSLQAETEAAVKGCDAVVHLAGILLPDCRNNPVRGAQVNLLGSLNVFEAALHHGLQTVVYSSTAGVFGPDDGQTPHPTTHYGAFKLAVEGSARAYWEDHRVPSVGFRPFVVYGPGREVGASAGPTLACRAAVRGDVYTVPFTGAAGFVYVEDVAAAFVAALQANLSGANVFNLVGEVATVEEVIQEIHQHVPGAKLAAAGAALPIAADVDDSALYAALPTLGRTSLACGVARTLAHYRQFAEQG